jgi:hypothetical protein
MSRAVRNVAELVSARANELGLDLSPKDVAFIISLFFEGLVDPEHPDPVDTWLLMMADDLNVMKDEL